MRHKKSEYEIIVLQDQARECNEAEDALFLYDRLTNKAHQKYLRARILQCKHALARSVLIFGATSVNHVKNTSVYANDLINEAQDALYS